MTTKLRNHIHFEEETHTYINLLTDEKYTSSTTFIGKFHKKFEPLRIAQNLIETHPRYIEKYMDIPLEDAIASLTKEWEQSATRGTFIHKKLEDYLTGKHIFESDKTTGYNNRIRQLTDGFNELKLTEKYKQWQIVPEHLIYLDEYKLAGQADLVLFNHQERKFKILDYKTNKKGVSFNGFQDKRMYPPIEHLQDCNGVHYALQLSLYAHFIEVETGYNCDGLELLWVRTTTSDFIEIKPIHVTHYRAEINRLLLTCSCEQVSKTLPY